MVLNKACQGANSLLKGFSTFSKTANIDKWLFNDSVLDTFAGGWSASDKIKNQDLRQVIQLALIVSAMQNCNATRDGKCLRYRDSWQNNIYNRDTFLSSLQANLSLMIEDIKQYPITEQPTILTGDARTILSSSNIEKFKLYITSPPYLNTFDYTDIYRPELFLGQFIKNRDELYNLRLRTIRSHIQAKWDNPFISNFGELYKNSMQHIYQHKNELMHKRIPVMIQAYFEDMLNVLKQLRNKADKNAQLWMVVSNSAYADKEIPVDLIIAEMANLANWKLKEVGVLRDIKRRKTKHSPNINTLRESVIILKEEIKKKFAKGYPKYNILFEDSRVAVLIRNGEEVLRCGMSDDNALHILLTEFITFERPEVTGFRKAIELFKQDIPKVTETVRKIIAGAEVSNMAFIKASSGFPALCHGSINPGVTREDVREMIIQHILTEDIFNTVFDETQFHRENNIARELEKVIATFFTGSIRRETLRGVKNYYDAINAAAAGIADHHEKQKFLKVVYETFYKSYNPKAADRLGVVYTPNEIVRFMIESADYLLHKYFDRYLEDPNVEILDPATGTGTFVCDLIDYIRKEKLEYKYKNEIHANEVAILPYYISNLNIEFTYMQKMGKYAEFENLCFTDTLDNTGYLYKGKQMNLFSEENTQRIKNQNEKKISVIIGNPPYNAHQQSENDNNKNREYTEIDKKIKETFIRHSTAQKTHLYDMYARFYRWAFDRLDENGIIAFVTNRSFIDSRTFDGFRKIIERDFDAVYIIDTKSDVRANPKIAGTTHNVFGIQTGIAIMFLVKNKERALPRCKIHYIALDDFMKKEEKLQWLSFNKIEKIPFEYIRPDKNNNWVNPDRENGFDKLIPLCTKETKNETDNRAIFELFTNGISTGRDEWVFDKRKKNLSDKIKYFINHYNKQVKSKKNG